MSNFLKNISLATSIFFSLLLIIIFISKSSEHGEDVEKQQLKLQKRIINSLDLNIHPVNTVLLEIKKIEKISNAERWALSQMGKDNHEKKVASTCTGSILNENIILTAAHCFVNRINNEDAPLKEDLNLIYEIIVHVGVKDQDISNYSGRWLRRPNEQRIV